MDNTIIVNPGELTLVKVGKNSPNCFYALVKDIVADQKKHGWWVATFYPLVPTKDFKLNEISWILDSQQIRGESFTMGGIEYQFCKLEFLGEPKFIEKKNANASVPIPKKSQKRIVPDYLSLVVDNVAAEKAKVYERTNLTRVK